jgi:hypothetical protein
MKTNTAIVSSLVLIALVAGLSIATPDRSKPKALEGTVVVPERFLRRWDPITIFFEKPAGKPGPEDEPGRFVTIEPAQPGAFTWLDAKTLQFKPAEPWPALEHVRVRLASGESVLATLMNPPSSTIPTDGADDLEPVEAITMTFPEPIPPESLARMTTIELRPRPGLDAAGARWLDRKDFVVKSMERKDPSASATYVLQLNEPIVEGKKAIVHFKLSLDDEHRDAFSEIGFSTLEAFRMTAIGCQGRELPVTPEGTQYADEQPVRCAPRSMAVVLSFSSPLALQAEGAQRAKAHGRSEAEASWPGMNPVVARNLVRFTPAVEGLEFVPSAGMLWIRGRFQVEQRYRLSVHPTDMVDARGRKLDMRGPSAVSFYFPRLEKRLVWQATGSTIERFGAQDVWLEGRGFDRVDLRIYPLPPLDRRWWPFTDQPVVVDESLRPPGPGEEPEWAVSAGFVPSDHTLREDIRNLGTAPLSRIVDLPLRRSGGGASFGLDLSPHLAHVSGKDAPGHYLVGVRKLDGSNDRHWTRVQVTDLSLSVVEEPHAVRFYVTSLRTGKPVPDATVTVDGTVLDGWVTFFDGRTDATGSTTWSARYVPYATVRRVRATLGDDVLVLDASHPPDRFTGARWDRARDGSWLQWAVSDHVQSRGDQPVTLCHVFTERPVYRPDEPVHIRGYVRQRHEGRLSAGGLSNVLLEIRGSGSLSWTENLALSGTQSFYHAFEEQDLPTGLYTATVMTHARDPLCAQSFRMEAYRIPTFEVRVHGPDIAPIDRPFEVKTTASYYAGGPVAASALRWRVTQFPYTWAPPHPLEGFYYSTDERFARMGRFASTSNIGREDVTDEDGAGRLELNPALEATAQPRTYVVEATVVGSDDQTVTATKEIHAVPAFVLGLAAPRFLEKATSISPRVIVVDPKGAPIAGQEVLVRLIHRTWHSHLQASDFTDGVAKYVTDVVDERVLEKKLTSENEPAKVELPISASGVYVVEVESRDRLGRAQVVAVDLYAGGDEPKSWKKPENQIFEVTTDKDAYAPGEVAKFLLASPFQEARALAIIEGPDANAYQWIDVKGGAATFTHVVKANEVPRVPIHFVLMRGRIGAERTPRSSDLGKPQTMAATKWITVTPVEHIVDVLLEHPRQAQPGDEVKMKIRLSDRQKKPRSGEVTLWLVDQAVLSLGSEQKLDPLEHFIRDATSYVSIADTRNQVLGHVPLSENPGGDGDEEAKEGAEGLLDNVTIRKNFKSVPVYLPAIAVPAGGETTVSFRLPDNLTNFKVRAKATSGLDRFGHAKSTIAVRLPVIVQPALPRFVRAGDRLSAGGIARVVEGEGGPGRAELAITLAKVEGQAARSITLEKNRALPVGFPIAVTTPLFDRDPARHPNVRVTVGVERTKDKAKDAFQVDLPMRPDRGIERTRLMKEVDPGVAIDVPGLDQPVREGTSRRTILVADEPAIVRMAGGLDFLIAYPHGTTEARVSKARAFLAMERFRETLHLDMDEKATKRAVEETLEWIGQAIDSSGRVAYWPGGQGYVALTAWSVDLMVEAKRAGYAVDTAAFDRLIGTLEQALRSDYRSFIMGEDWAERAYALETLARAQRFNSAYAAELSRKTDYLNLESIAGVTQAFIHADRRKEANLDALTKRMWNGVIIRLHQGNEIYGGLQDRHGARSSFILPSETRTLAELIEALDMVDPNQQKLPILTSALVTLGRDDGWGTTNANMSAMTALAERLNPGKSSEKRTVEVVMKSGTKKLELSSKAPVAFFETDRIEPIQIRTSKGSKRLIVRIETSFVPEAPGSKVEKEAKGFVVTRRNLVVKEGEPPVQIPIDEGGRTIELKIGDVVEEHVQVVNPKERHYVAVIVPLAAGMEPMNPNLATSPPEARPAGQNSLEPTHLAFMDDHVTYYFDTMPKGTFDVYFRTRASTEGQYTQPAAVAEMLYDGTVSGRSPGAKVVIGR